MDDTLSVLLPPMGSYVVFFLIPFVLGLPAINSHDVIGIIITVIAIIFIVYIFNYDTAFGVISICAIFSRVFDICSICAVCCIRDAIFFLRWVFNRVITSWIFLLSIVFIVRVNIDSLHRLILWNIHILDVVVVVSQ